VSQGFKNPRVTLKNSLPNILEKKFIKIMPSKEKKAISVKKNLESGGIAVAYSVKLDLANVES